MKPGTVVGKCASPVQTFRFLGNREVGDEAELLGGTRQQFDVEPHSCIGKDKSLPIKLHANSSFSTLALQALPLEPLSLSLSLLVLVQMSRHSRRLRSQVGDDGSRYCG